MRLSVAVVGLDVPPPTARRLRYSANCWSRHTSDPDLNLVTTAEFDAFRRSCHAGGLSPVTIESIVNDVLYVGRRLGLTLDPGRRLYRPPTQPVVPSLATIGRLYLVADQATWPRRPWACSGDWWHCLLVVALWTGFRRGDLARLRWDEIQADRIALTAGKTGWRHEVPLTPLVRRHLALLDQAGRPARLFDLPRSSSFRACYDQLARLARASRTRPLTLQSIRRLAITQWACSNAEAGRIIHGCGLGVMRHYLDPLAVLQAAAPLVRLPEAFLTDEERDCELRHRQELLDLYARADQSCRDLLLRVARRISR